MVTLANMRYLYGDVVERATLAHHLLAPVASRLSGDPLNLHCRCVLGFLRSADGVRANLAPFGDIEAVAYCALAADAVMIFRTAESAAVVIERQDEAPGGLYSAVPPPKFALPLRVIDSKKIQVALYPPNPDGAVPASEATRTGSSSTEAKKAAAPGMANDAEWTPRPVFVYLDLSDQGQMILARGAPGTTEFVPSLRSKIHGPVRGEDGHLWIDGTSITYYHNGMDMKKARIRAVPIASHSLGFSDRRRALGAEDADTVVAHTVVDRRFFKFHGRPSFLQRV